MLNSPIVHIALYLISAFLFVRLVRRLIVMRSSKRGMASNNPFTPESETAVIHPTIAERVERVLALFNQPVRAKSVYRALRKTGFAEPCTIHGVSTLLTRNHAVLRQRPNGPSARQRRNAMRFTLRRP
jgi:membrane glycosyltransferase